LATLDVAVVALLEAHPGLAALIGTRLYPERLPDQPGFPALTYKEVSEVPTYAHDGDANYDKSRFQFDCWAVTKTEAKAVAAQLRDCLGGYRGISEGVTIHMSKYVLGFVDRNESLDKWRAVQDYKFEFST
jgi:hypothetical protein